MRLLVSTSLLVLWSCSPQHADLKVRAEQCVSKQIPSGTRVSAARARALVNNCQQEISAILDQVMPNACEGRCDYSKNEVVEERHLRKEVIERMLMNDVSDEVPGVTIM